MIPHSLEVDSACWCSDSRMLSGQDSRLDALTGQLQHSHCRRKKKHKNCKKRSGKSSNFRWKIGKEIENRSLVDPPKTFGRS